MKKINLLSLFCLLFSLNAFSQIDLSNATEVDKNNGDKVVRCYTEEMYPSKDNTNPNYQSREEFERWLAPKVEDYKREAASRTINAIVTIPVVYHVIHDNDAVGSGSNLSAALINAQNAQLNNDFGKIAGTSGDNNNAVGADTEIRFCMARRAPNGTTLSERGINRINRNSVGWTAPPYGSNCSGNPNFSYVNNTIKPQSQWDPNNYLNIWVIELCGGVLGYATWPTGSGLAGLPAPDPANQDGVVVLPSSVGSTTNPNPAGGSYNKGRTLTHELGHFWGLRHIWGDGGCSVDDFCADTPTSSSANFGCPNVTKCSSTDMVENYMDYTDDSCMNIFTEDQKARIQAVLANSPRRSTLPNSTACNSNACTVPDCATTINNYPYSQGFESSFGNWRQNTCDDFNWTRRSGGTPSSGTGPSSAAQGSTYAYMESSTPNYSNKKADLYSPCYNLVGESSAEFVFQYHMYGSSAMGSLVLQAKEDVETDVWQTVWSRSGNQGNAWRTATVDLSAFLGTTMKLRFLGETGTTWKGDMAIDDLEMITAASCTDVSVSITTDNYPSETTWRILQGGAVQASGGPYSSSGTTYNSTACLPSGCYSFQILDSYGDGICCSYGNGSFTVTNNSTGATIASGGDFDNQLTFNFCVNGNLQEPEPQESRRVSAPSTDGLSLFPNPVQDQVNVSFKSKLDQDVEIRVMNQVGAVVSRTAWAVHQGMNQETISTTDLNNGSYILMVKHGERFHTQRFVVIK